MLRAHRVRTCGPDSFASVQGTVASSCEHGNELWGSIKGKELLE